MEGARWDWRVVGRLDCRSGSGSLCQTIVVLPLSELLQQQTEPSLYRIPRYVGHACGQGGAGFPLVWHSSPKSWHNQSEDHEVIVRGSSGRVNVVPGHLPAWKGEQRVNAPVVLGARHACA